jgi:thiamine-phosphate pyrophosphorylase
MKLDPFYLIVDSADWIERLVPLGVKLVQLRKKDCTAAELRQNIRRAKTICAAHACQLIINDYWRMAIDEGCDFVHLGQSDLDGADLSAIRAAGLRLGISTHDGVELARALTLAPSYIALGPIYPTMLKEMPWAPQGLAKLAWWKDRIGAIPLVAIGGLTPERARAALTAGADSAAVVTDILRHLNPEARTREWRAAVDTA